MNPVKEFFENIADSWNNDGNNYKAIEELFELVNINACLLGKAELGE